MKGIESANQDMGFRVGVGGGVSGVRVRDNNALSQGSPLMVYLLKGYLQGSVSREFNYGCLCWFISKNSTLQVSL